MIAPRAVRQIPAGFRRSGPEPIRCRRNPADSTHRFRRAYRIADAQIVVINRRRRAQKGLVRLDNLLCAVRIFGFVREGDLRRAAIADILEIPDFAAGTVQHSVAEQDPDRVFAGLQIRRDVVGIVVQNIVRIRDIRREKSLRDALSVDEQLIKSEPADRDFRGFHRIVRLKGASEVQRGNHFCERGIIDGRADETG